MATGDEIHRITERRRNPETKCDRHDAVIASLKEGAECMAVLKASQERIEASIAVMMERQMGYIKQTARLETIVTNGLSHNVSAIRERMEEVCNTFGERLEKLEAFSWFREWVTGLRDDLFKNVLKLMLAGGLLYCVVHFGDVIVKGVVK